MKLTIALAAVFAVSLGAVFPSRNTLSLEDDLNDFTALIPKEEIKEIFLDYFVNDAEVEEFYKFITSEQFRKFILSVESLKDYQKLLKFLNAHNIRIYEAIEELHEALEMPPYIPPPSLRSAAAHTGMRGMVDDIEAILPLEKIKELYFEKLQTSEYFREFIKMMSSDDFKKVVATVRSNPQYKDLIKRAKEHGLDVDLIAELVNKIFGWDISNVRYGFGSFQ